MGLSVGGVLGAITGGIAGGPMLGPITGAGGAVAGDAAQDYLTGQGQPTQQQYDSQALAQGRQTGLESAENLYGMPQSDLGAETQDILARRRARLDGSSPSGTRLREQRNRQVRMARAGGRSAGEQEAIKRKAESDIADVDYAREGQALTDYQKLIGRIIGGTSQLEMGHAGLAVGAEQTPMPQMGGNALGTVICTELFKQGLMNEDMYFLDVKYGEIVRAERPHVYTGYRFLAGPVVKLMQKSPLFTNIIAIPALHWAKNMTGEKDLIGKCISVVGEFVCGIVGKLIGERYGRLVQRSRA